MKFRCAHCGKACVRGVGAVNRAHDLGLNLYCGRKCSGLGRRIGKTKAQKKEEKRFYDIEYRRRNLAPIKVKKRAYFQATYDPEQASIERRKRAKAHAEYCRTPEYRAWKHAYDQRRTDKKYGPFAEANRLMIELNREIKGRATNAQIKWQNGTSNKTQFRKRAAGQKERSRPRHRERRDGHTAAHGQ